MKHVLILVVLLFSSFACLYAQDSTSSFLGRWYIIYKWYPDTLKSNGTMIVELEKDGKCTVLEDSIKVRVITWEYDSIKKKLLIVYPKRQTVYNLTITDKIITGGIFRKESEQGRCYGNRDMTDEWKILQSKKKPYKKLTNVNPYIEYALRDNKTSRFGAALLFGYDEKQVSFNPEMGSIALQNYNGVKHVSSNALFLVVSGLLAVALPYDTTDSDGHPHALAVVPIAVNMLTNFNVLIPLKSTGVSLSIQQSTDYFFFYNISKVVPETKFGVRLDLNNIGIPLQLHSQYCMPWTTGYGPNSDNYFSVSLAGVF